MMTDRERFYSERARRLAEWYRNQDVDETVEITRFGGETRTLNIGRDRAMMRARASYLAGEIDVYEFEDRVGLLLGVDGSYQSMCERIAAR